MSFEELKIRAEIVRALAEMEIISPTPIQEKAIPAIKEGKDVIGISKTGSGKTIAFGIPIVEQVQPHHGIQALIVAPTRELAVQISKEMEKLSKHLPRSIAIVFGGVSLDPQAEKLSTAEIVVGTPGRLLDHLQRGTMELSHIRCVVLDEADKMAEMGFIEDIRRILDATPRNRQVLLFGATISGEIESLKRHYMHGPMVVREETQVKEDFLKQYYYDIKAYEKFSLLVHLLKKEDIGRTIIFCSKRSTVEIVTKNLQKNGIAAEMIHGKLTQNKRLEVIENFHKGNPNVLVASGVAARGLDIKGVSHIFNYDLSDDPQEYVHRVGRTARAGSSGKAITLLDEKDYDTFRETLHRYRMPVERLVPEQFPRLQFSVGRPSYDGFQGRFPRSGGRPRPHGQAGGYHSRSNWRQSSSGRQSGEGSQRFGRPRGQRPRRGPRYEQSRH